VPSHPAVVRNVFPDLRPYHESLVLSRFVLVDAVPANGESWFLGQVFAAATAGATSAGPCRAPYPRGPVREVSQAPGASRLEGLTVQD
jgi:hypothetical protein